MDLFDNVCLMDLAFVSPALIGSVYVLLRALNNLEHNLEPLNR